MKSKVLIGLLAAAIVLTLAAWAAAPIVAAQSLIRAAQAGDARKLETLVDFPSLRQSLKEELNAALVARMRRDGDIEDALGGLGLMLAPMILSGAVDTLVTPEVVAQMVVAAEVPDPTRAPDTARRSDSARKDIHKAWGYRNLNRFAVTLTDRDRPDERLALILERRGLFTWKLAAVDLQTDQA
jgi:hypothetical protein